jgi:hypothetical protein
MGLQFDDDDPGGDAFELTDTPDVALASIPAAQFNATPYPPIPKPLPRGAKGFDLCPAPPSCLISPLPLRETAAPRHRTAAAARLSTDIARPIVRNTRPNTAADIVTEFLIGQRDIAS